MSFFAFILLYNEGGILFVTDEINKIDSTKSTCIF